MSADYPAIASSWLHTFVQPHASPRRATYLRDVLTFTWKNRTLRGKARIAAYLKDTLKAASVSDVEVDTRLHLTPQFVPITHAVSGISSGFTFETAVGHGQGYVSLVENEAGEWMALIVFTTLADIRGYEEAGPEKGIYGGHTLAWHDINRTRREEIESNPHVLIIGGGQTGLNVGARFKQMNIPSTVRVWYILYPDNWPTYTPRDKLADWLEQYGISQDLAVWTDSRLLPTATYDSAARWWSVVIDHAGDHVTLHPTHIVVACGTVGAPRIPSVSGAELFTGINIHSSAYGGGKAFVAKRTLVVGAGNSAADICQDLAFQGAKEVTMLQRSSTCVVSAEGVAQMAGMLWPSHVPTDIADFKVQAMPYLLAGLSLTMGNYGSGQYPMIFERFGGLDFGVSKVIASGRVKIKQGVEPARFTEKSAVFTDGSSLDIDAVIFDIVRRHTRQVFGDAVIDQTGVVWGIDEEGELNGCYCPSGHPGLWYAAGDLGISRFYSKQLALEIKTIQLGLLTL
ncbi:FAD/NAD-P-binding domain-containing protein [Mycena crocata]|nr:FAD/NAD-P-binding domain-containing protein [Mycena crocata]